MDCWHTCGPAQPTVVSQRYIITNYDHHKPTYRTLYQFLRGGLSVFIERQMPMCYLMIFAKTHISMKGTTRIEDNFHPIFS